MINIKHSFTPSQLRVYIIIGGIGVWCMFLLANAPHVSPFAWIGMPISFLELSIWFYLGNILGIIGMAIIGGLIRILNEQKQTVNKQLQDRGLTKGYRKKKSEKKETKKDDNKSNSSRGLPKPVQFPFSPDPNRQEFGTPSDFNQYRAKMGTFDFNDKNYDMNEIDNYFDSQLVQNQPQPSK